MTTNGQPDTQKNLKSELAALKDAGQITDWVYEKEVPTMRKSYLPDADPTVMNTTCRLIDRLQLTFPNGSVLHLTTYCSGTRENSCLKLDADR